MNPELHFVVQERKRCTQCKRYKPLAEFSPIKARPRGASACKPCRAAKARETYSERGR